MEHSSNLNTGKFKDFWVMSVYIFIIDIIYELYVVQNEFEVIVWNVYRAANAKDYR